MISCLLRRSTRAGKKFQVIVHDPFQIACQSSGVLVRWIIQITSSGRTRTVHFGAEGTTRVKTGLVKGSTALDFGRVGFCGTDPLCLRVYVTPLADFSCVLSRKCKTRSVFV